MSLFYAAVTGAVVGGVGSIYSATQAGKGAPGVDPNVTNAAANNAELARETLDFNKEAYADQQGRLDRAETVANRVVNQQLGIADENAALSRDYADYMKGTFRPVEQSMAYEAFGFNQAEVGELEGLMSQARDQAAVGIPLTEQQQTRITDLQGQLDRAEAAKATSLEQAGARQGLQGQMDAVQAEIDALSRYAGTIRPVGRKKRVLAQTQLQIGEKQKELAGIKSQYEAIPDVSGSQSDLDKIRSELEGIKPGTVSITDTEGYKTYQQRFQELQAGAETRAVETAAGRAGGEIGKARAAGEASTARDLARMGIDPSSGAWAATRGAEDVAGAALSADAMNRARDLKTSELWAKKADVANLGRNLPSNQATSAGIALNAGNSSVGNAYTQISGANSVTGALNAGYGLTGNLNTAAGNLSLGAYNADLSAWNAQQQAQAQAWQGIGSLAGTGLGAYAALK